MNREALKERAEYRCEMCGEAGATNWHHRRNKSQGRDDSLESAMLLCGSGTTGCHGLVTQYPYVANYFGWTLRRGEDPSRRVLTRHGWAHLTPAGGVVYERDPE